MGKQTSTIRPVSKNVVNPRIWIMIHDLPCLGQISRDGGYDNPSADQRRSSGMCADLLSVCAFRQIIRMDLEHAGGPSMSPQIGHSCITPSLHTLSETSGGQARRRSDTQEICSGSPPHLFHDIRRRKLPIEKLEWTSLISLCHLGHTCSTNGIIHDEFSYCQPAATGPPSTLLAHLRRH